MEEHVISLAAQVVELQRQIQTIASERTTGDLKPQHVREMETTLRRTQQLVEQLCDIVDLAQDLYSSMNPNKDQQ